MTIFLALGVFLLGLGFVVALAVLGLRSGDRPQDPQVQASLHWSLEAVGWVPHARVVFQNCLPAPVVFSIDVRPTPSWLGWSRDPLSVRVPWPGPSRRPPSSAVAMFVAEPGAWATSDVAFVPSRYATVTTTLHQTGGRIRVWKASLPLLDAPAEPEAPTLHAAA